MLPTGTIAIDIETEPFSIDPNSLPEPEVKLGNTTDPIKVRKKIDEARQKQFARLALDPHFSSVLCVCLCTESGDVIKYLVDVPPDHPTHLAQETAVILEVAQQLNDATRIASFNGASFDIPYLRRRALLIRQPFPQIECGKYKVADPRGTHADVCRILADFEPNPLSISRNLLFYAKQILNAVPPSWYNDLDKSNLRAYLKDYVDPQPQVGFPISKIIGACSWDVRTTMALWQRLYST